MKYKGYQIIEESTGWAPKWSKYNFFLEDEEESAGSGESIEDCKKQIDFIISEQ